MEAAWEAHHANKLEEAGFRRRMATSVFLPRAEDVNFVVHGDDNTFITGDDTMQD